MEKTLLKLLVKWISYYTQYVYLPLPLPIFQYIPTSSGELIIYYTSFTRDLFAILFFFLKCFFTGNIKLFFAKPRPYTVL